MQTLNPYLAPILSEIDQFLDQHPLTHEHSLIKHLQKTQTEPFQHFHLSQSKDLFNAHFLCMHALYHLKNQYAQQGEFLLRIHAIQIERINIHALDSADQSQILTALNDHQLMLNDPLESYYLDSRHYFETQEDDIHAMLKSFWQCYLAQDEKAASLDILELPRHADHKMIQQQYRRLAQKHHPDKGGCAARFNEIRQAKSILDKCFK
jgi:DnaJ-domain-containing protein 1